MTRARVLLKPRFYWDVLVHFFGKSSGMSLTGSVAFFTLLSLIPLLGLLLIVLSTFVEVSTLSRVVATQLESLFPGEIPRIMSEVTHFVDQRSVAGGVGLVSVVLFGGQAFSSVENAMAVIFSKRRERVQRRLATSLVLPYLYIGGLGAGLAIVTGLTVLLEWAGGRALTLGRLSLDLGGPVSLVLPLVRVFTEVVLFASIYLVFPGGRVNIKHALLGGLFAALLWEGVRRLLTWYYLSSSLSVVSLVYGSLANVFVGLVAVQTAAMIVLISAQLIADYESLEMTQELATTEDPARPR